LINRDHEIVMLNLQMLKSSMVAICCFVKCAWLIVLKKEISIGLARYFYFILLASVLNHFITKPSTVHRA